MTSAKFHLLSSTRHVLVIIFMKNFAVLNNPGFTSVQLMTFRNNAVDFFCAKQCHPFLVSYSFLLRFALCSTFYENKT
jgi:hypothetical protein